MLDKSRHTPDEPDAGGGLFSPAVPPQNLLDDPLLAAAPQEEFLGARRPNVGGVHLLAALGRGGMGAVYYGFHSRLEIEVAVKVPKFDSDEELGEHRDELVRRFYREARVAARIKAPHLVNVFDVNEAEGGLFYQIMEFVRGESGGAYLRRLKKDTGHGAPEGAALAICLAACEGLVAAHQDGVIHRDIKPDNILIPFQRNGRELEFCAAKLADLGLARETKAGAELTASMAMMGTLGYAAPEQVQDAKRAGKPADVFSLGATLYALLSGVAPFRGSSAYEVMLQTVQAPHEPLQRLCPRVSAPTAALTDRCLAKDPGARPADATALRDAFASCLAALDPGPTMRAAVQPAAPVPATPPSPGSAAKGAALVLELADAPPAAGAAVRAAGAEAVRAPAAPPRSRASRAPAPASKSGLLGCVVLTAGALLAALVLGAGLWAWAQWGGSPSKEKSGGNAREALPSPTPGGSAQPSTGGSPGAEASLNEQAYQDALEAGDAALSRREWKTAESEFRKALALKPGEARPSQGLKDAAERAQQDLQTAASLAKQRYDAALEEARSKEKAKAYAEAQAAYEKVLTVPGYENDATARQAADRMRQEAERKQTYDVAMGQGQARENIKSFTEARAAYERATAVAGYENDPAAQQALARMATKIRASEATLTVLKSAKQQAAGAAQELTAARYRPAADQYALALQTLDPILKAEPNHAEAKRLAEAARRDREYAEAMDQGTQSAQKKQWPGAASEFERALRQKPADEAASQALSEALAAQATDLLASEKTDAQGSYARVPRDKWDKTHALVERALEVRPGALLAMELNRKLGPRPPGGAPLREMALELGKTVKLELVFIPPGEFSMGSPNEEEDRSPDEGPVRVVKITKGFWMGKYEVTQQQFELVMGKNPSTCGGLRNPVEAVAWKDADDFCKKVSQTTGQTVRLPTEAEWEYACRAGTRTRFPGGSDVKVVDLCAWYEDNAGGKSHPVGQKAPNAWGLHDMTGNVWEWCQDWYDQAYYAGAPDVDPRGPDKGLARVMRGGSWFNKPFCCRCADRYGAAPTERKGNYGFRVVLVPRDAP